jgi:proteasome activator subunit 4
LQHDRYLHIARSAWQGLPMLYKEPPKSVVETGLSDLEVERLVVQTIDVRAGFALTDPTDWRYQMAHNQRQRLGRVAHDAASALKQGYEGEDHIDAVLSVVKAIDAYLLDYALSTGDFDSLQKSYATARESVATVHIHDLSDIHFQTKSFMASPERELSSSSSQARTRLP